MARTVCIDEQGAELATYPYAMKGLRDRREGDEFFVGQERWRVVRVEFPDDLNAPDAEIIATLKK